MNKQELIDKAINEANGLWSSGHTLLFVSGELNTIYPKHTEFDYVPEGSKSNGYWDLVCTVDEYTQRAKELGWVNGFKYGVEYPTNGKKPDLPDDTEIEWYSEIGGQWYKSALNQIAFYKSEGACEVINKFRITDQRYKPISENQEKQQNISDLSESNQKVENVSVDTSWYERGELPPVGWKGKYRPLWHACEVVAYHNGFAVVWDAHDFKYFRTNNPEIFRQIRTERDKFHDSALKLYDDNTQV